MTSDGSNWVVPRSAIRAAGARKVLAGRGSYVIAELDVIILLAGSVLIFRRHISPAI